MPDIAHDLMVDLEKADWAARPGARPGDSYVAAVMRRNGFSDADIAATLGPDTPEARQARTDGLKVSEPG